MKKLILLGALASAVAGIATAAHAALPQGAKAPPISTRGALAGKDFGFDLATQLEKGPVVLYFFPKAFTKGCTLEANAFAEAMPDFRKAGATVIGMSADDLPTLRKFSKEECRDAFPVARASAATIKAYDVGMQMGGDALMSERVSYVIAPNGRITMVHADGDWRQHVALTLKAVRALQH